MYYKVLFLFTDLIVLSAMSILAFLSYVHNEEQITDTYSLYVYMETLFMLSIFTAFLAVIYLIVRGKKINRTVANIHVYGTVLLIVFSVSLFLSPDYPRRYYRFGDHNAEELLLNRNALLTVSAILFVLIQLCGITNLIIGLLKKKSRAKDNRKTANDFGQE